MSAQPLRLLLADDEPLALRRIKLALQAIPDVEIVGAASDGAQAITQMRDLRPDVVLLDIKMPRLDGLEVLKRMRETDSLRRVPVVILSSSREESDLVHSWNLGVNAYVVKPVDVRQFFQAVQTLGQFWAVLNESPNAD